jgi:hypothetical protein
MTLAFELSGYRRLREHVVGTVKVTADGSLVFADSTNLSSAQGRAEFIGALKERLADGRPEGVDFELELLRLLEQAEIQLAADPAPGRPSAADDEERVDDYARRHGRYEAVRVKETVAGPIETRIPLSNFVARIVEDVTVDDGAEQARFFTVTGALGGRPLPEIRIPAHGFAGMTWPTERWGVQARVLPGQGRKDLLRDAIQAFSADARRRTIFGHLGWRDVDGKWAFLTADGVIGADGVEVDVARDGLGRYALPSQPGDVRAALEVSLALLDVCSPRVGYAAWAIPWRSIVFDLVPCTVMPHWVGQSGRLKSSIAAAMLAHFGPFRTKDDLPARWEFTENIMEKGCFLAKDVPFVIDDLNPEHTRIRKDDLERRFSRIAGNVGNLTGRRRMGAALRTRLEYRPRGLVLSTGEYTPILAGSRLARIFPVPFDDGSVDRDKLTAFQARLGILPYATRGFVEWVLTEYDHLAGRLPERLERFRDAAAALRSHHSRLPENVAHLYLGLDLGLRFAVHVGVLDNPAARVHLEAGWKAFLDLAAEHGRLIGDERPTQAFIGALGEALATGQAWLADRLTGTAAAGESGPASRKLGWLDQEGIYLLPATAFEFASGRLTYRGGVHVSERALHQMLEQEGLLRRNESEPDRLVTNKWCEGGTKRVLNLRRDSLGDLPTPKGRQAECWSCGRLVSSDANGSCSKCGWLACTCGACGCRQL